jgi:ankyrin repeat protein
MSCLPALRHQLLYAFPHPVTGAASCVFLSPWSSLAQRTAQFIRVLQPFWRLAAHASRAAKAALLSFSPLEYTSARNQLHSCAATPCIALHVQESHALPLDAVPPASADLDMWRDWLSYLSHDPSRDLRLLKARGDAGAATCSPGLESLCDVTWGANVSPLLLTPPAPSAHASPYPAIIHALDISSPVRRRIFSALAASLALNMLPAAMFPYATTRRQRLAEMVVARVYGFYRGATQRAAADLFDQCLARLRHARKLRKTYSDIFANLSSGKFDAIRARLRAGDVLLSRFADSSGKTALHYCILFDNLPVAQALVAACTGIDIQDNQGFSALSYAAMYSRDDLASFLIEEGADTNSAGFNGWGALHFAANAKKSCIRIIELLLAGGANVDAQTTDLCGALHIAAQLGRVAVVVKLVSAGADVSLKDSNGRTPLHVACDVPPSSDPSSWTEIVKALLRGGADANDKDARGNTALHHAVDSKAASIDLVKELVAARADLNVTNKNGKSPLQRANSNPFISNIAEYLRRVQQQALPPPD